MTFDKRIKSLMQSIASHDRQIAELVENDARQDARLSVQTANIDKLVEVTIAMR